MKTKTLLHSLVKITLIAFIIHAEVNCCLAQQKAQFTQYMFNGLVLNPAMAGIENAPSVTFINKIQWARVDGAPTTQTLSASTRIPHSNAGVGITFVNDKIGVHNNQYLQASFAYHLPITEKSFLSLGLQAGADFYKSNYASIAGNQNIDPGLNNMSYAAFIMGVGILYKSSKFEGGISAPSIIPHQFAYDDSLRVHWGQAHYFSFLRYHFKLNNALELQPSVLIKYLKGTPLSFDINAALVIKQVLTLALAYRKAESIDFLMTANVTPNLQLGVAYDYGIGEVSLNSGGSFELMAKYMFRTPTNKISSPR
ncbi:MAG: type IX secretion system membrane protein PorP/SprF [Chryseolinea sp.]